MVGNISAGLDPASAATLRAAGVPVLHGAENGLLAFRHLFRRSERRAWLEGELEHISPRVLGDEWTSLIRGREVLSEQASTDLLAQFEMPMLTSTLVASEAELTCALDGIAWPVVLKTAMPGIAHKTEAGGVVLGVSTMDDALTAYRGLSERLGPVVTVQRQIEVARGTELFLGMVADAQFGPIVTVGAGGIWVEMIRDSISLMPPISRAAAHDAIGRLGVFPLLTGARRRPSGDLDQLVDVIVAFGQAALHLAGDVAEIDINPLYVGPDAVIALDALIVPKSAMLDTANFVDVAAGVPARLLRCR